MSRMVMGFAGVVVVMIAIPLLLAWSGGRRRPRVGRRAGVVVLRMPRGHNVILAAIAFLPGAAFAALALGVTWAPGSERGGWILAATTGLLALVAGGYLLALEVRGRIRVDDFGIEKAGAFTRHRASWHDIARLDYNPVNRWFYLTTTGGRRLYVGEGLEGISDFAELALQRLPPTVLAQHPDAAEALRDLAAG
jgi:hypothetical protein